MPPVLFSTSGARPPHCLYEVSVLRYTVTLECNRCSHGRTFDAHALWWLSEKRGWNQVLRSVPERFRCELCEVQSRGAIRRPKLIVTDDDPIDESLRRPPMDEWKHAVRRRRSWAPVPLSAVSACQLALGLAIFSFRRDGGGAGANAAGLRPKPRLLAMALRLAE